MGGKEGVTEMAKRCWADEEAEAEFPVARKKVLCLCEVLTCC